MEELNVVIVGAGRAGSELMLPPLRNLVSVNVSALCDTNVELARKIAGENNIPHVFSSLEEALEKSSVDAVFISTPTKTHFELAKMAMEKCCNVLLEKPLVETISQARELKSIQEKKGVKFSVIHNHKFMPGIQEALRLYESGEIGEIIHYSRAWMFLGNAHHMLSDPNHWCHKVRGGILTEIMPHLVYNAYQFVGEMELEKVFAKKVNLKLPWLPLDEVNIVLSSDKGYVNFYFSANPVFEYSKGAFSL